jgi:hypothetical protein
MIIIFGLQQKLMVNVNAQVKKLMCGNEWGEETEVERTVAFSHFGKIMMESLGEVRHWSGTFPVNQLQTNLRFLGKWGTLHSPLWSLAPPSSDIFKTGLNLELNLGIDTFWEGVIPLGQGMHKGP